MRLISAFILLLTMQSCAQQKNMIVAKDIKSISVEVTNLNQPSDTVRSEITDQSYIAEIVKNLNENYREPIKFYPTHKLRLTYNGGEEKMIYCNGASIKYDGLTYKLKKSIKEILSQQ